MDGRCCGYQWLYHWQIFYSAVADGVAKKWWLWIIQLWLKERALKRLRKKCAAQGDPSSVGRVQMNTTINPWGIILVDLEAASNGLGLRIRWWSSVAYPPKHVGYFLWRIAADLDDFLLAEEVL